MPSTAHFFVLPADATPWLIDRLHPQRKEFVSYPSWPQLNALLKSLGADEFEAKRHGIAMQDVWDYLDVSCDQQLSHGSSLSPAKELARLGYVNVYAIPHDMAKALESELRGVTMEEKEMRLHLEETREMKGELDMLALTEAFASLKAAIHRIRVDHVGLVYFGRE